MLVSCLGHIADGWKNVNMLLQIETYFITYVTCIHADWPAHLGSLIRVYIVCVDLVDAQADLVYSVCIGHKASFYLEHLK